MATHEGEYDMDQENRWTLRKFKFKKLKTIFRVLEKIKNIICSKTVLDGPFKVSEGIYHCSFARFNVRLDLGTRFDEGISILIDRLAGLNGTSTVMDRLPWLPGISILMDRLVDTTGTSTLIIVSTAISSHKHSKPQPI